MIDYQKKTRQFSLGSAVVQLLAAFALLSFSALSHAAEREVILSENGQSSSHWYSSDITPAAQPAAKTRAPMGLTQPLSHNHNYWVQQSSIGLNTDHDHDGHYSSFSLTLDIDTSYATSFVYAVLYLSLGGGDWTEYAVTGNFTIHGSGSYDSYFIEADLDSGYPSGYYNHYIEVYDAYSHDFLVSHGPNDSHALIGLPFESRYHDQQFSIYSDITLSFTGAGATGLSFLLPLAIVCIFRCRRLKIESSRS